MAYVGSPPASRVLSSADIAQGSVTLDDINFTDQPTNMDISGTIDKHTMRLADGVTVVGDVTISDNLIFSKISDDGNAITLTNDSSTRTITGTGSLEASTLTQTPNSSLTGMTGEISSSVLSKATFEGTLNSSTTFSGDAGRRTAKVWANFNGSSFGERDSYNVTSFTDNGTGDYTVTFDSTFADTNYTPVVTICSSGGVGDFIGLDALVFTTTTIRIHTGYVSATDSTMSPNNASVVGLAIFSG